MSYIPKSDSVVAFQSQPSSMLVGASIVGLVPTKIFVDGNPVDSTNPVPIMPPMSGYLNVAVVNSVITVQQSSVYGTVGASIIGAVPTTQIAGSVMAVSGSFTAPANQSVSGTVTASITGKVQITDATGADLDLFKQGDNFAVGSDHGLGILGLSDGTPKKYAFIRVEGVDIDNETPLTEGALSTESYNMILNAQGTYDRVRAGSTLGAILVSQADTVISSISGNVPVTQSGAWSVSIIGSLTPPANQSVSGTVGASIIGTVPVVQSGTVATSVSGLVDISGSVFGIVRSSIAGGIFPISGSVAATVTNFPANQSVSGTVATTQSGTWISSVVNTVPSSMLVGASIIGTVPIIRSGQTGTVISSISGNVATTQAGTWISSVVNTVPSSMLVGASIMGLTPVTVNGQVGAQVTSVVGGSSVFQFGTWKTSIASNYATGAASVVSALGDLILGVRNDTMATVGATTDGFYGPLTIGPVGENIVANAPINKWIQGTADLRVVQGASVQVLAAQGTSVFTYVTGVQVANLGPSSVLVTLTGGLGSVLGYTIAPGGGGSNIIYPNALKTGANSGFSASISGVSSVLVSAQGFISKT